MANQVSLWRIKAAELLKTKTPNEVSVMLFKESGYKDLQGFRKKVGQVDKIKKAVDSFLKTGEYKEVRDESGKVSITDVVDRRLTDDELFERYGRSKEDWRISMVWFKDRQSGFLLSCCFIPLVRTPENTLKLSDEFIEMLNRVVPIKKSSLLVKKLDRRKPEALLLIAKQDLHINKFDIGGDNSIDDRFLNFKCVLINHLQKASASNRLSEITYIVGSDEFNSEWTGATTKFTPQKNILTHQESFEKVTDFNIEIIKLLCTFSPKINVVLLNGNHDYNVGWHLANVLKHVFKGWGVNVDDSILNTKVLSWADNLILINHGDEMKPKELAIKFPLIAKEKWSNHSNYFVITGDKHHELAHDFDGIMTYQVPQLSKARSDWDDKKGYITGKAEMVNFLFEKDGLSNILRSRM